MIFGRVSLEKHSNQPRDLLRKHMRRRLLVLLPLIAMVSGCVVGSQTLTKDIQGTSALGDDSILVIGLNQRYRVHIIAGTKSGEEWLSDETPLHSPVVVNTFPEEGFIVARVPGTTGNKIYGLTGVLPDGIGIGTPFFKACAGNVTPVFTAQPGKVVYAGQLELTYAGGTAQVQEATPKSLNEVKSALGLRFPAIAAALQAEPMRMERLARALCSRSTIPVILPSK